MSVLGKGRGKKFLVIFVNRSPCPCIPDLVCIYKNYRDIRVKVVQAVPKYSSACCSDKPLSLNFPWKLQRTNFLLVLKP